MELLDRKLFFDRENFNSMENGIYSVLISNKYFTWLRITLTGKDILFKLDGLKTLRKVLKEMAEEYELPEDVIQEDLINFCESCLDHNIIFESLDNIEEIKYDEEIRYMYIDITNACNLECIYCNKCICRDNESAAFLKPEALENYMAKLFPNKDASKTIIYITGGEPLLHPNLEDLFRIISKYKCSISLLTNGILLDESKVGILKEYCDHVVISLDDYEEEKNDFLRGEGSYTGAISAANICASNHIPFVIATTPTKYNYENIDKMFSLAQDLGTMAYIMNQPICYKENEEVINGIFDIDLEVFAEKISQVEKKANIINSWRNSKIKLSQPTSSNIIYTTNIQGCLNSILSVIPKANCSAGINRISIDVNGDVYPCHNLHIKSQKISSIEGYQDERAKIIKTDDIEGCASCEYKIFCLGGCRAEAFYKNKNIKDRHPLCESFKKSYEGLIWTPLRPAKAGEKNGNKGC